MNLCVLPGTVTVVGESVVVVVVVEVLVVVDELVVVGWLVGGLGWLFAEVVGPRTATAEQAFSSTTAMISAPSAVTCRCREWITGIGRNSRQSSARLRPADGRASSLARR